MQDAIHIKTTVLPGKRVEFSDPQLAEGDVVDVFLVVSKLKPKRSALDIIYEARSRGIFRSKQDIDDQLKQERDAWDR